MKNIKLSVFFAVVFGACAGMIPQKVSAQEFIKEYLWKDRRSIIRELSREQWVVFNDYSLFNVYTLVDPSNPLGWHIIAPTPFVEPVNDFEILNNQYVFFCGGGNLYLHDELYGEDTISVIDHLDQSLVSGGVFESHVYMGDILSSIDYLSTQPGQVIASGHVNGNEAKLIRIYRHRLGEYLDCTIKEEREFVPIQISYVNGNYEYFRNQYNPPLQDYDWEGRSLRSVMICE